MSRDSSDDDGKDSKGGLFQVFLPGSHVSEGTWDTDNASWVSARGPAGPKGSKDN